jgi:acyl carrier protein
MQKEQPKVSRDEVLALLGEVCRVAPDELTPDKHLIHDFDLDSVLTLELLMALEERLGREISEVDAAKIVTVGDLLDFVQVN